MGGLRCCYRTSPSWSGWARQHHPHHRVRGAFSIGSRPCSFYGPGVGRLERVRADDSDLYYCCFAQCQGCSSPNVSKSAALGQPGRPCRNHPGIFRTYLCARSSALASFGRHGGGPFLICPVWSLGSTSFAFQIMFDLLL